MAKIKLKEFLRDYRKDKEDTADQIKEKKKRE